MSSASSETPAWRMPAEWEPHAATWLAWPHNPKDWPGKLTTIPHAYAEIVRKLVGAPDKPGEAVHVIVQDAAHESRARSLLRKWEVPETLLRFFQCPTDRGWTRDMGPIWVKPHSIDPDNFAARNGPPRIIDFGFDGWSKYPNHKLDAQVPKKMAKALKAELIEPRVNHIENSKNPRHPILEGGAIDVNGEGMILATEECLLDPKTQIRNPGFSAKDYDQIFADNLHAQKTIWLGKGIVGDDTHGHVDDFARFVNPTTIVLAEEKNPKDPNHAILEENRERLESAQLTNVSMGSAPHLKKGRVYFRRPYSTKPTIVRLPMPAPMTYDGLRLPASYANFYIANAAVLVPTFNDPNDRIALGILSELFTDRPVIGIHAVDLVWGLGTLHCLTQQQPL